LTYNSFSSSKYCKMKLPVSRMLLKRMLYLQVANCRCLNNSVSTLTSDFNLKPSKKFNLIGFRQANVVSLNYNKIQCQLLWIGDSVYNYIYLCCRYTIFIQKPNIVFFCTIKFFMNFFFWLVQILIYLSWHFIISEIFYCPDEWWLRDYESRLYFI
jgi:hypothetical protein